MSKIVHFSGFGCILRSDSAVAINLIHAGLVRSVFQCFLVVQHLFPSPATHTEVPCTPEKSSVEIIILTRPDPTPSQVGL